MTAEARIPLRRRAPSWVVAAFVCALALLPAAAAHAVDHTTAKATHAVVAQVAQTAAQHRADSPDLVVAATAPIAVSVAARPAVAVVQTDSSSTVDSQRTRGPPVQAAL